MAQDLPIDRLMKLPEVMKMTSMGRSTIYDRVAAGTFPAPLKLSPGSVAWIHAEIQEWIRTRPRMTSRRARKPAAGEENGRAPGVRPRKAGHGDD